MVLQQTVGAIVESRFSQENTDRINRMYQDGHDCMDAGGRSMQEAKTEDKPKHYIHNHTFNFKKFLAKGTVNLKSESDNP